MFLVKRYFTLQHPSLLGAEASASSSSRKRFAHPFWLDAALTRHGLRRYPARTRATHAAARIVGRSQCWGLKACSFVTTAQAICNNLRAAAQRATFGSLPAALKWS